MSFLKDLIRCMKAPSAAALIPSSTKATSNLFRLDDLIAIASAAQVYMRTRKEYEAFTTQETAFYSAQRNAQQRLFDALIAAQLVLNDTQEHMDTCSDEDDYADVTMKEGK